MSKDEFGTELEIIDPKQLKFLEALRAAGYSNTTEVINKVIAEPEFEKIVQIHTCAIPQVPLEKGTIWHCGCERKWTVVKCEEQRYDIYIVTWKSGFGKWKTERKLEAQMPR